MSVRSTKLVISAGLYACSMLTFACGDDNDNSGGVSTGLPKNAALSSLGDADARQACMNVSQSFSSAFSTTERKQVSCTLTAIVLSVTESAGSVTGDIAGCKELTGMCMKGEEISADPISLEGDFADEEDCESASVQTEIASCDATVGEYEACMTAILGSMRQRVAAISCDGLSNPTQLQEEAGQELEPADLAGCNAFVTKCPDVSLGGSSSAG
jgi:hypothetical protein